jgi:biotin transport system substrate-specific component
MVSHVYADIVRPARPWLARLFDAALVAGFSLVIALCSQAAIPLPFTPVPATLQTFAVILAGCLLGSARGTLAVGAYIVEGLAGLPVFAGGTAGLAHLLGPTGGYLVGFLAAAFVTGFMTERGMARRWLGVLVVLLAGELAIYVPGVIWLGAFVGPQRALALGLAPFLIGDSLKTVAGWGILSGAALVRDRATGRGNRPPV